MALSIRDYTIIRVVQPTHYQGDIGTSKCMFGRVIWGKLAECIFENYEISRKKRGQYQSFKKPLW